MADTTTPTQRRLAEIGLRAASQYGFALAGGHAIAAHGILARPSEDVDLFADWHRRAEFPVATEAIITAYQSEGYAVDVDHQLDTFARLHITDPAQPESTHRVELVSNWRAQPPVVMEIGPVLHADDVIAGKVDALYNRAAARDFLDIDAAISSGQYTLQRLCELAEAANAGFNRAIFADMLRMIDRLDDEQFTAYGATLARVAELRTRVPEWCAELTK
jgi:hypothetical protein